MVNVTWQDASYNTDGFYEITPINMDAHGNQYSYNDMVDYAKTLEGAKDLATKIAQDFPGLYTVRIRRIHEIGFMTAVE